MYITQWLIEPNMILSVQVVVQVHVYTKYKQMRTAWLIQALLIRQYCRNAFGQQLDSSCVALLSCALTKRCFQVPATCGARTIVQFALHMATRMVIAPHVSTIDYGYKL